MHHQFHPCIVVHSGCLAVDSRRMMQTKRVHLTLIHIAFLLLQAQSKSTVVSICRESFIHRNEKSGFYFWSCATYTISLAQFTLVPRLSCRLPQEHESEPRQGDVGIAQSI